jgi:hypothetical protein
MYYIIIMRKHYSKERLRDIILRDPIGLFILFEPQTKDVAIEVKFQIAAMLACVNETIVIVEPNVGEIRY